MKNGLLLLQVCSCSFLLITCGSNQSSKDGGDGAADSGATQDGAVDSTRDTSGTTDTTDAPAAGDIASDRPISTFVLSGSVAGLAGGGLILQNNLGNNLTVAANQTVFTFAGSVTTGTAYSVTVLAQPSGPKQTCTVAAGAGTIAGANVTSVAITCATDAFSVGGSVSGLLGSGLVLRDNGGDDVTVVASATSFTFPTAVASGAGFAVTIQAQPTAPSQTCTLMGGTGTVGAAGVTSVAINCATNTYLVGGSISGLAGTVVLQNSGGDARTVTSDGSFAFATPIASGAAYGVTVLSQPGTPSQTCSVTQGSGNVAGANVASVAITCTTNPFSIGGSVSGLLGSGLVLRDNGRDDLPVAARATSFTFPTAVASGAGFAVTIQTQPTSPSQTCTLLGDTGTVRAAGVTSVAINCTTSTFLIGGSISGLAGTVVLQNNGGDDRTVTSDGSFAFATPMASGAAYAVTVLTQPGTPSQTCTVALGSDNVGAGSVSSVQVTCVTNTFNVRVSVFGLAFSGLTVQNDADVVPVSMDGTVVVSSAVLPGTGYAVSVASQPSSQVCTAAAPTSGLVGGADVTVAIACVNNPYRVRGTLAGALSAVGLNNGADDIIVTNGAFAFPTRVTNGTDYAVSITSSRAVVCTIANGSGVINQSDAVVTISCAPIALVYHLPFDGNANDTSGNGNDGVVNGATLVPDRHGIADSAYAFDGTSWIEAPGGALPINNTPRTLTAWIKPYNYSGLWGAIYWGNNDCPGLMWGLGNQGSATFWGGCNDFPSGLALVPNTWSFAAVRFTPPNEILVRVNDQVATTTVGDVNTLPSMLWIGGETTSNDSDNFRNHFLGEIDDIRIYNGDLSNAELDDIFALP